MTLPNRVAPDGMLAAEPARGTMFGNRGGRFHDPATRGLARRRHASRQWLCCLLSFKGRRRAVWGHGYTELFFCDEVTALAAGHRPCFECRREAANAYAMLLAGAEGGAGRLMADEMDRRLHEERLGPGGVKRVHEVAFEDLPDGAMVAREDGFFAVRGERLLRWSFGGYVEAAVRPVRGQAKVLTPPTSLIALRAGYAPVWHPSAEKGL